MPHDTTPPQRQPSFTVTVDGQVSPRTLGLIQAQLQPLGGSVRQGACPTCGRTAPPMTSVEITGDASARTLDLIERAVRQWQERRLPPVPDDSTPPRFLVGERGPEIWPVRRLSLAARWRALLAETARGAWRCVLAVPQALRAWRARG